MPTKYKIRSRNFEVEKICKITSGDFEVNDRDLCALVNPEKSSHDELDFYNCLITSNESFFESARQPVVYCGKEIYSGLREGNIILINPRRQEINVLFDVDSNANCLFTTDCCNSHCLMCPQPPQNVNSIEIDQLFKIINCLPIGLKEFCITGGEPTLLGDDLEMLLNALANHCPECHVHMLTNGRNFKDFGYTKKCLSTKIKTLSFGIPLYSSDSDIHNYIVQDKNAFRETLEGVFNLAKFNALIEIRIVLTKINCFDLEALADFIYRNITFADHIAFMGMEHMGYVKLNWDKVYIDPAKYQDSLYRAVRYLHIRGMNVSIYNLPLCILDKRLWKFSKNSISDFKQGFDSACETCEVKNECGGLFVRQKDAMQIVPIITKR